VARYLAGCTQPPSKQVQNKWEMDLFAKRGDGQPLFKIGPDFEEYFEALQELIGEPRSCTRKTVTEIRTSVAGICIKLELAIFIGNI
jgi:hypothetical protein